MRVPWVTRKPLQGELALEFLAESARSGWYSNDGPAVRATTADLHAHMRLPDSKKVLLCASGTAALHAVVAAFNHSAGRALTWATQAVTFPSAILGPLKDFSVVVDNDPALHGPSLPALEALGDTIQGVIITNLFGMACDVEAYSTWCAAKGKVCVFDNAASPMTFWRGGNLCQAGDAAIISLHETKPMGRGEGGAVVCAADFAPVVHRMMNFGFEFGAPMWVRLCQPCASNWRMGDVAAAFIRARLQLLTPAVYAAADALLRHADALLQRADVAPHLKWVIPLRPEATSVFPSCLMLYASSEVDIAAFGTAYGIEARRYYTPLAPTREEAPLAWDWFDHCVCLPFDYMADTPDSVTYTIESLVAWMAANDAKPPVQFE